MENSRDRLIRYLNDAWTTEKALVSMLRDMADEVNSPSVQSLFIEHAEVTHRQEELLEARIRALGEEPSSSKGMITQVMAKVGDMLHAAHDEYDKTTQNLMKAYATENLEMAIYESLETYSRAIGDHETAQLAHKIFTQEKDAADRVWPHVAQAARLTAEAAVGTVVESRPTSTVV